MRAIIFRGKCKKNGKWVHGNLEFRQGSEAYMITNVVDVFPTMEDPGGDTIFKSDLVISETVGQYTGLIDHSGNMLFEGDIVRDSKEYVGRQCVVEWRPNYCNFAFMFQEHGWKDVGVTAANITRRGYKIIGNIHDEEKK